MLSVLRIFFGARGTNPWSVLGCLLLAGLFEGIGMASLLPLLTLTLENGASDSPIMQVVASVLAVFGLSMSLGSLLLLGFLGILMKAILHTIAMRHVAITVAEVATGLRLQLIKQLLDVRWEYFTRQPVGLIANAISVDATRSGQAYLTAANFLSNAIRTAVYGGIALMVSWKLALAALIVGLAIAASLHFLVRKTRRAGRRQTETTAELVTYVSDALGNIKPLKAMGKQGGFSELFERKIEQLKKALRRQAISQYLRKNIEEVLTAGAIVTGFYLAVTYWRLPISEILVVGVLLFRTLASIGRVQQLFQIAVQFESPYQAMQALIEEAAKAREPNFGTQQAAFERSCRFEQVGFGFEEHRVLDRVSLEIPSHSLTVLTGPSGVGKTTLSDLLLGLYQPDEGKITIDDVPLADIDLASWRRLVGYVPQELVLLHDTVLANVTLGDPTLSESEAQAALEAAGAWNFVAAFPDGLKHKVGEKGTKLSGGQRQRIALARALIAKPKLLILDEVTSALDPQTERDICQRISALSRDVTVLAITHRDAWTEIADRIYQIEDGAVRLVKDGANHRQTA